MGLAVVGTGTVSFDDVRIAELDDWVEAHAVALGQTAGQAFEELLGKRHIRWFLRGNGELRAGRFADRDESQAIAYQDTMIEAVKTPNHTEWFSHVQVVGASDLADKLDLETMARKGYRFIKVDNPDVMTPRDCYQEASTIQTESEEVSDVREFTACAQVRQERQDLVRIVNALDGTDALFTVVGLCFEYAIAEDAVAFDMRLQGTLALERIRREIRRDRRKNFLSGRITAVHKVTRSVDIRGDGSPTVVRGVSVPLTVNMDDLKAGDMVLVALVNGVYFVLNAYPAYSRSEPYRFWWYSETLPSPVEFKWESDACTNNGGLVCYWG